MTIQEFLSGTIFEIGSTLYRYQTLDKSGYIKRIYTHSVTGKIILSTLEVNVEKITRSKVYTYTYVMGRRVSPVLDLRVLRTREMVESNKEFYIKGEGNSPIKEEPVLYPCDEVKEEAEVIAV